MVVREQGPLGTTVVEDDSSEEIYFGAGRGVLAVQNVRRRWQRV